MVRYCIDCKQEKDSNCFEGQRKRCKQCRNDEARQRRLIQKEENVVLYKAGEMARSAHSRIYAPSRDYKRGYKRLERPFEFKGSRELTNFIYEKFGKDIEQLLNEGKTPSLDRIDSSIGYTPDNIRVIDFAENTLRGVENTKSPVIATSPEGEELYFESVAECSRHFGTLESHVRAWLKGKHKPKNKYVFKYAGRNRFTS